jgi:hypothetical protein
LSEDELVELDDRVEKLGFKSRSGLVTAVLIPLLEGGFRGIDFIKLGIKFSKINGEYPDAKVNIMDIFAGWGMKSIDQV